MQTCLTSCTVAAALEVRRQPGSAPSSRVLAELLAAAEERVLQLLRPAPTCRSRTPSKSRATRCRPACGRSTRKLGVTSRSEALERAVDLRLPSAGGNHPRLGDASPDGSASIGIGLGRRLAMKDRDRAGRQCAAAARYAPRADSGPAAFRPTWLSMLPSILRQSVSVLGQEGPMVCLCGPAAHRGNAPRAMARWRPTRDVECQLKSYCGRRIPGHDPLSASRVAGGRPIGGPAP